MRGEADWVNWREYGALISHLSRKEVMKVMEEWSGVSVVVIFIYQLESLAGAGGRADGCRLQPADWVRLGTLTDILSIIENVLNQNTSSHTARLTITVLAG